MARKKAAAEKTNGKGEAAPANALTAYMAKMPAISQADKATALARSSMRRKKGSGDGTTHLAFSGKTGDYKLGQQKKDVEGEYIIHPDFYFEGFICWKDSKPMGRYEVSIYADPEAMLTMDDMDYHGP